MLVSRSDVIFLSAIHRDSCVTGANAIASSVDGSAVESLFERTNRSCAGPTGSPVSAGFHRVAGAMVASSGTFRGPTRRSRYGAIDERQLAAAICRSASVIVTCASFSASANVAADTAGPAPFAVPNVGGAPAGGADAGASF